MVKGLSIKFRSYEETVPQVLKLIKLDAELKKHGRIVLKPSLRIDMAQGTSLPFVESVVKFCLAHKNPGAEILIAEGANGASTASLFEAQGYGALAERYGISLVDLNKAECDAIGSNDFMIFEQIMYPSLLRESFVISLPALKNDEVIEMEGAVSNMRGAYPAKYYKGFFSSQKNKLDDFPITHQIHDILMCKMPDLALIDAHEKGVILAGRPIDMDKQAAKILGLDWRSVGYLRILEETLAKKQPQEQPMDER